MASTDHWLQGGGGAPSGPQGRSSLSVSVNSGHVLISLIVQKNRTKQPNQTKPKATNPLPPSSCSELCTWLVKLMTEASCLLCFLAYGHGLTTQHCSSRWHRALGQAQSPSRLNPGTAASPEGLCSTRTQSRAGCSSAPSPGQTDRPQCSQLDILFGFTTDRWLLSQCLRPMFPTMEQHQPQPQPQAQSRGRGQCWAAAPSSDSSNTSLSKQLSLSALTAAPTRRPSGDQQQSTQSIVGVSQWPQTRATGTSHTGPLSATASPQLSRPRARGMLEAALQGRRLQVESQSPQVLQG